MQTLFEETIALSAKCRVACFTVALLSASPLLAQFNFHTITMPPPNNGISTKLTGTAAAKSSGIFTLSGVSHAMRYDFATNSFELNLDEPGIHAVNLTNAAALGADGIHYAGWEEFQSNYILALGTHNHCAMWTEGVGKQIMHPSDYGDSWCVAVDNGNAVGTAYLRYNQSICVKNACTNLVRTYMTAILNGAPIVTNPNFCYTPFNFGTGGDCFSRARGISGDSVVGDYNFAPSDPSNPATFMTSFGNALDSSPQANPFPQALLWHPSRQSVIQLNPAGFVSSIALATNGIQQGGWATDTTGNMHAILWSGSAESALDLSPPGYTDTRITGFSGAFQVGDGWVGGAPNAPGAVHHGLVWQGSPAGVIDLNQYLPAGYTHLTITGADADGNISGYMTPDFNGAPIATGSEVGVLFTPTPSISPASLTLSPSTVLPGDTVNGTVSLGAPATEPGVFVTFTSSNTALFPAPAPTLIPTGQTTASFAITVSTTAFQPDEGAVTLTARTGLFGRSASITVTPQTASDPIASLTVTPARVQPGNDATVQVTLASPAPPPGVIVNFSSSNPNVLAAPPAITIPTGQASAAVNAHANANAPSEPVTLVLSAATGTTTQQATVIVAQIPKPTAVSLGGPQNVLSSAPGGTSGLGFVSLSAVPLDPITVTFVNRNPALSLPATLTQSAGSFFVNFTYSALPVPVDTPGTVTATANGVSATSTITITATPSPFIRSLAIPLVSPTQTWSSGETLTGTVTLSGPAYLGGMTATLAADNAGAVTMPGSLTVPAGASTASFAVKANQVGAPTPVTISAALPGFAAVSSPLTIIPAPLAISSFSATPFAVIGPGVTTNGVIALNQPAPSGGVVISLAASPGAAKVPATVTVAQGQTSANFTIQGNSVSGSTSVSLTASYQGVLAPLGVSAATTITVSPSDSLRMAKGAVTWSKSTNLLTVTATGTNPQAIVTVLNANGNVPLGTMTGDGSGNFTFQTTIASISSVNLKSSLGGATGQGVTVVP